MIFQHTWEKILSGEKTQTRRIVQTGQWYHGDRVLSNEHRTVYCVSKTYAVQPSRTAKAVARIEITGIRREDVRGISEVDALAEGVYDRRDFFYTWVKMHDKSVVEEFIEACLSGKPYTFLVNRPAEKYQAWVLEFKLV